MSAVKEKIMGAVNIMSDEEAGYFWRIISAYSQEKDWGQIPSEEPDNIDIMMLNEIDRDDECRQFVPCDEAMRELGLA